MPVGDPKLGLFKLLWGSVKVDESKTNVNKDFARAKESSEKKNFIKNEISKYIDYWRTGMAWNKKYAHDMLPYAH